MEKSKYLVYLAGIILAGCKKREKKAPAKDDKSSEDEALLESKTVEGDIADEIEGDDDNSLSSDDPSDLKKKSEKEESHFYYGFDSSRLSGYVVDKIKDMYAKYVDSNENFVIYGNCDQVGGRDYNMGLSVRRAAAVRSILLSLGIHSSRIKIVGLGQTVFDESEDSKNRVAIITIDGKVDGKVFKHPTARSAFVQDKVKKVVESQKSNDDDDDDDDDDN